MYLFKTDKIPVVMGNYWRLRLTAKRILAEKVIEFSAINLTFSIWKGISKGF